MEEYYICFLKIGFGFLHILQNVFLEDPLIGSSHLRPSASHDFCNLVFVHLPPSLLSSAHVFLVGSGEHHFRTIVDIESKFPSMAK